MAMTFVMRKVLGAGRCLADHPDMRLHAEIPLIALLRLMHLRVAPTVLVLGRTGCIDQGGIDDRAGSRPRSMLVKLGGKDTQTVVSALIKQVRLLPAELRKSLTWDRGTEMAQHKQITIATNLQVYFCDPQSPWQRGTNENTNRLLRQYLPKQTDLSIHTQTDLDKVARRLNQRPKKPWGIKRQQINYSRVLRRAVECREAFIDQAIFHSTSNPY